MREIEHALAGRAEGDHPDDPADPDLEPRRLPLELTAEAYALWLEARRRLEDELGERLDDSAVVTAMARRVLEPAATSAAPATSRPPYQLAITLCPRCDRATQAAAGDVVDVCPETVEQACCDAVHLGRVDGERPDAPTRTIPARTRTAVLARDQHRCSVPGCRSTRGLELHHIQWRSRGGDHRPRNLTTTCTHHHAAVHHGRLRVTGEAPHALRFERAGDTPYATDVVAEVRAALRGLGFRPADITRAVDQASAHVDADAPLDAWLRAALRACPRPATSSPG
jgi:5-methylcytosine-specific restriction endonuclease McrA